MKHTKRIAIVAIFALILVLSLMFTACDFPGEGGGNNDFFQEYTMYKAYAEENGITPLDYETWLKTIKGEKGDDGAGQICL